MGWILKACFDAFVMNIIGDTAPNIYYPETFSCLVLLHLTWKINVSAENTVYID